MRKIENIKGKRPQFFSIFDIVLLAMLTGLSIGFKEVVGILVRMITGPLGIPGGALAGGFYMLWLPLAIVLTSKRGSAFLVAAVQVIVMISTGLPGNHGIWTVLTYLAPAIFVEAVFLYKPKRGYNILHFVLATMLANLAGTFGSNLLFFRMAWQPLLFTLLAATMSGALGGLIAFFAFKGINKTGILKRIKSRVRSNVYYKFFNLEYVREICGEAEENNKLDEDKSKITPNSNKSNTNSDKLDVSYDNSSEDGGKIEKN